MLTPLGLIAIIVGIALWILIFRVPGPLFDNRETTQAVTIATLAVAVVGTLLNDGGITIWITITITFAAALGASWIEWLHKQDRPSDSDLAIPDEHLSVR